MHYRDTYQTSQKLLALERLPLEHFLINQYQIGASPSNPPKHTFSARKLTILRISLPLIYWIQQIVQVLDS